jgi:DNA invertase Pin-like site-specific DNA recombinase
MSLIGYARVSTRDQSLEQQLEQLTVAGCDKIFAGKQSGKSEDNGAKLNELVSYCRAGDVVVVSKFDRLGRSLSQVLTTIQLLADKGVCIKTLDGQIDTSNGTPMAKAFMQLLGVFAELEHSFIVDRLQSGRKATGKLGGRPAKLSKVDKDHIKDRVTAGDSKSMLSREYDVSRQTIQRCCL